MDSPTPHDILVESVAFWSVGLILFVGRLWSRAISKKSWKNLQADDWVMVATFICYTTLLVLLQFSSKYGTNQMMESEMPAVLADPDEIQRRILGSKIVIGSNQCYLLTLWGVKACLLSLYYQMTFQTPQNVFVKIVIAYVILGLLAIEIPYFFILCRPFRQYWAVPVSNPQCANYFYYCIIQTVFNISSDALMLLIPIPLIIKARAPPLKKAVLCAVFSLGIFVIMAAIIHKYYNFSMPNTTVYMLWDIRETSTSIYVANLMCWWPLMRKVFGWSAFVRSAASGKRSQEGRSGNRFSRSSLQNKVKGKGSSADRKQEYDLKLVRPESQEAVNKIPREEEVETEDDDLDGTSYGESVAQIYQESISRERERRQVDLGKAIVITTEIEQVNEDQEGRR